MIIGNSQVLDWLQKNLKTLDGGNIFYIIVNFDASDYFKIKNHGIGHSYKMWELVTEINVHLWGGSGKKYEVIEDYKTTIVTYRNKYHKCGEKVRIAVLKAVKNSLFFIEEYFDIT